ncbi:MAG: aspartyl protease family protein [Candidatus Eremiobacteraeota bacterium]|nr:aspartyl protease family protein [Candidatus Eremiobacteraeota bacterium]
MNLLRLAAAAFAAVSLFVPGLARADADPRIAQLIAASGSAQGVASLASVSTLRIDSKIKGAGLSGTLTQYVNVRDGRFAETTNLAPVIQLDGYDGRVTWNADGSHLVWNDGSDSGQSSEINQAYFLSYALYRPQAAGAAVAWIGPKAANGQTYDALSITPAGSKVPFELWFDQTTHLPARANFVNGFNSSSLSFSDYRRVNGLNFAHAIHQDSSDGNNSDELVMRVAFDPPNAQAALARPQTRPTDFSMLKGKTSTTIPFALTENHVLLDVMLNGKGPYHFIFDTGGSNVIDPAVAKEIGAFGKGSAQGSGVGSQTESLSFANVAKLQVGDAVLRNQFFAVVPTRMGFGVSTGRQVDGLIGWEVLARYITTFDYANRQVVLSLPGTAAAPAGGHVVPFVFYSTQPQVACTIDGIPAECTIDTGARDTISFMTPFLAAHPQIVPKSTTAVGINGFGLGGPALGKLGRVREVGIDDLTLTNLVADYSTQTAGALTAPFVAANVGGNLLRRFAVTFDYGNGTMTLVPNSSFDEADAYERSGLFLIRHGASIVVADARPGTPAANAGIAKGDAIASVNGTPVAQMPLYAIRQLLMQAPGTTVTLGIANKDGSQRTVTLTLKDYV